jgi:hypothetical protein
MKINKPTHAKIYYWDRVSIDGCVLYYSFQTTTINPDVIFWEGIFETEKDWFSKYPYNYVWESPKLVVNLIIQGKVWPEHFRLREESLS